MSYDKSLQSRDDNGFPTQSGDVVQKTQARLGSALEHGYRLSCASPRAANESFSSHFDKLATNHFPCRLGAIIISHANL
jgi:hypothetical protein